MLQENELRELMKRVYVAEQTTTQQQHQHCPPSHYSLLPLYTIYAWGSVDLRFFLVMEGVPRDTCVTDIFVTPEGNKERV